MAAMNQQFKITKLAKDLGLKSKELVEILAQNGVEAKTTQKALEPAEFDILFETLTRANQISNIGDYLDGKTQIPTKLKKEAPAEKKETDAKVNDAPVAESAEKETKPAAKKEEKKDAEKKPEAEAPVAPKAPKAEPAKKTAKEFVRSADMT